MNKYLIIAIIAVVVIGGGIFYRTTLLSEERVPVRTGVVREVTVVAKKDEWRFVPEEIEINRGDHVVMTVINEDDYDHGIAIDSYGVSQRMPANSTRVIEFDATQPGDFPFYCSVPCGEGEVDGVLRTHFDMIGRLHVKSLISETR
ncbi:MAG: cupredoxin domain-containing protein [bacterium]|nr:cupredoxin domain-containing protein [bacterium]MDZ4285017.1 cupredoxin domain-containing protein [Patescibacteria group bacterium]